MTSVVVTCQSWSPSTGTRKATEKMFLEGQLYLPVRSDPESTPQMIRVSTSEQSGNSSGVVSMSNEVEKSHRRETD